MNKNKKRLINTFKTLVQIDSHSLKEEQIIKYLQKELKKFMAGHMRRKALIQRLVKAGIWEDK